MTRRDQMPALLDSFIYNPDTRVGHETLVHAPTNLVMEVARNFDMQSIPVVRVILWLRTQILRFKTPLRPRGTGTVILAPSNGWGILQDHPGRTHVSGAACQPWQDNVVFSPTPAEQLLVYAGPEQVKIVWSIEEEVREPALTRLYSETQALSTDDQARAKFKRYWRYFGIGIRKIHWFILPAIRRHAEQQWRTAHPTRTAKSTHTP